MAEKVEPINILTSVKTSLRISHDKLDFEIAESIQACQAELIRAGVIPVKVMDDRDDLIRSIIKLYCKIQLTDDANKFELWDNAFKNQMDCLRKSGGYYAVP